MENTLYKFPLVAVSLFLTGCVTQVGHKEFYEQTAPSTYPETQSVHIFEYENVDLDAVYRLMFNDYLIIGRSSFNGPYESPNDSESYAKSIGADVFITNYQFKETRTTYSTLSLPTTNTSYVSGYGANGTFYSGTVTTHGTKTTTTPISVKRYDHDGLYLKNINHVDPLWEKKRSDFKITDQHEFGGKWRNKDYQLELIQSGKTLVALMLNEPDDKKIDFKKDELKLVFDAESGNGIYLMGDKTPMPATFEVNRFGHLEVKLIGTETTISFEKET